MKPLLSLLTILFCLTIIACGNDKPRHSIHFAVSAEYPPFEYQEHGKLKGFDIDLAKLIAKHLGKNVVFDNMQFSTILPALSSGQVDAAISTITITPERQQNFDFTAPYYFETMATVFRKDNPIQSQDALRGKIIACQLGSTMEIWLKKHFPHSFIVAMDNNNQAIEALKSGHTDVVLMDGPQGAIFSQKNPSLSYTIIAKSEDGYGIALPKNSLLKAKINRILNALKANGDIEKLQKKWLEGAK
ncbi:substrate-binding periplasmic protein [Legionella hackeliae]|uniref:Amino acid (Glutamine) ABC transporter, periplasmic amino acid binding protein n=1 Tax=Legionella hackeliae TaxID=449 RepID=A0A0A8UKZ5_LEGHA|nr:ABC transporter substrate-binding protein [Legionella hackeliae]KTD14844.1 amino acid ABC transporter substrate-binding protein [Legionella hackeliae]CEK09530.1 Amino acid (Glutamine) ABC transporter, periplasmic amino acid binding protein [Legionella hackeliae]STX49437.1 amino acid ABC transporter substrate-binding protein [Legionella hackeliae]